MSSARHGSRIVPAEVGDHRRDLLGFDEAPDGRWAEHDALGNLVDGNGFRSSQILQLPFDQRSPHEGWAYRIHGDAVASRLECDGFCQAQESVLGGHIGGLVGMRYEGIDACDVIRPEPRWYIWGRTARVNIAGAKRCSSSK